MSCQHLPPHAPCLQLQRQWASLPVKTTDLGNPKINPQSFESSPDVASVLKVNLALQDFTHSYSSCCWPSVCCVSRKMWWWSLWRCLLLYPWQQCIQRREQQWDLWMNGSTLPYFASDYFTLLDLTSNYLTFILPTLLVSTLPYFILPTLIQITLLLFYPLYLTSIQITLLYHTLFSLLYF